MSDLNTLTSLLAFVVSMPICFAYLRISRAASDIVRHMAISLFCVVGSFAWRALYWDMLPVWIDEEWAELRAALGGTSINTLWNACFVYGCLRGLMALHLMVPVEDRRRWPVWRAWLYPPWRRNRLTRKD